MARIFSEDFEGGANGTAVTPSNTTFDYVRQAPQFTDTAAVGELAMRATHATGATDPYGSMEFTTRDTIYLRAYIQVLAGVQFFPMRLLTPSVSVATILVVTDSGQVRALTGSYGSITSNSPALLTGGAWARVEWAVTPTTQQVRLFTGDDLHGVTPTYDSGPQAWSPPAGFSSAQFGVTNGSAGADVIVDGLATDDTTWVGPAEQPEPEPTVIPHWFYDDGSTQHDVTDAVWADLGTHWHNITTGDTSAGGLIQTDRIAYIGDSLTHQDSNGSPKVNASLGALGWPPAQRRVSGHIGRPIIGTNALTNSSQSCEAVIAGWRAEGWHPRVWVVALGANNIFNSQSSWTADMNNLLDLIAQDGPARVYIVGQVFQLASENAGSTYSGMEPTMQARWEAIAATRGDVDVRPIDLRALWRGHFNGGSEAGYWTGGDGRHNTAAGYDLRNTLIGTVIGAEAP